MFISPKQLTKILMALVIVLLVVDCFGQGSGGFRQMTLFVENDTIRYDSVSTVPGSFKVKFNQRTLADSADYRLLPFSSTLILRAELFDSLMGKFIEIEYRAFAYNFEPEYSLRRPTAGPRGYNFRVTTPTGTETAGDLKREGSLTRGISVGNSQNSSLNSDLNLQLAGRLNDRYQVRAAISDRNIPLQPEGTTHQLQDFDRIFIEVEGPVERIVAGDQVFTPAPSHFLRYNRKVQGMSGEYRFKPKILGLTDGNIKMGASLAKGRYNRQTLKSIEGNQGPYRLHGANGESFIIILSGSEQVHIDGALLERGSDRDYVIDYNSAQITFTDKRMISANSRIIVEFEYSDRSYARSLLFGSVDLKSESTRISLQVFSETDMKNQNFQQVLGDEEKNLLASVGDDLANAVLPRIDSVAFNGDEVLYKMVDTTVAGNTYSQVLVYSIHPDSAHFRAVFSYVGLGKGNYVKTKSAANGKVFQWVAPVSGMPSGDYDPISVIIAPKSQQALTLGLEQSIGRSTSLKAEMSVSKLDLNTFSELDHEDDIGAASFIQISNAAYLNADSTKLLKTIASIEWAGMNHNAVERYLPAEFERDWNIGFPMNHQERLLASLGTTLLLDKKWENSYRLEWLNMGADYQGLRNNLQARYSGNTIKGSYRGSLLTSQTPSSDSRFYRHTTQAGIRIGPVWLTSDHLFERNEQHQADTLSLRSAAFSELKVKAALPDSMSHTGSIAFRHRNDLRVNDFELKPYSSSNDIELSFAERKSKLLTLVASVAYRELSYSDTAQDRDDSYLISRLVGSSTLAKGNLRIRFAFETSTGSEVRKEYSYLKVADGQGVYAWNDYNQDSVKQLDEFEVAIFNDQANYIRIFIPTDDLISIVNSRVNADVELRAPTSWRQESGLKRFASKFSSDASLRFDTRRSGTDGIQNYNPFPGIDPDTNIQAFNTFYQVRVFYRRGDPKISAEVSASSNEQRSLLANGFENSFVERYTLKIRTSPIRNWNAALELGHKTRANTSEYFIKRNFDVQGPEIEPSLSWQPSRTFRVKAYFRQTVKNDRVSEYQSKAIEFGTEGKYSFPGKGIAQARLARTSVSFDGDPSSPVAWEMLNALVPGINYTWNLGLQYSLKNNIQVGFNYEGRKPSSLKTIHTGMVQARYIF